MQSMSPFLPEFIFASVKVMEKLRCYQLVKGIKVQWPNLGNII